MVLLLPFSYEGSTPFSLFVFKVACTYHLFLDCRTSRSTSYPLCNPPQHPCFVFIIYNIIFTISHLKFKVWVKYYNFLFLLSFWNHQFKFNPNNTQISNEHNLITCAETSSASRFKPARSTLSFWFSACEDRLYVVLDETIHDTLRDNLHTIPPKPRPWLLLLFEPDVLYQHLLAMLGSTYTNDL